MKKDLSQKSRVFWEWFVAEEETILGLFSDDADLSLTRVISRRVSILFKGLGWEIGPGKVKENQFVISPNRDRDRLQVTRRIIQMAPSLPTWEFHPAKPKKDWDYEMEVKIKERVVLMNFRNWNYSLIGFSNNSFFDIDFFPEQFQKNIDKTTYKKLAVLLAESEIGEELLIERIDRINVYSQVPDEIEGKLTPVYHLFDHLYHLLS